MKIQSNPTLKCQYAPHNQFHWIHVAEITKTMIMTIDCSKHDIDCDNANGNFSRGDSEISVAEIANSIAKNCELDCKK